MNFEELAFEVQKAEAQMTDEQRVQFWEVIQMGYCPDCGRQVEGTCMYRRDE